MRGVKNFCISKCEYSAFFCTKNYYHILKTREKRCKWNSTILKIRKNGSWNFQNKRCIFIRTSKWLNFICIYFHEFLRYGNDFWCKRKLNIHTLRCKSFLPTTLIFYPLFYVRNLLKIGFEHSNTPCSNQKRGLKNFCIFRATSQLSFASRINAIS